MWKWHGGMRDRGGMEAGSELVLDVAEAQLADVEVSKGDWGGRVGS